MFLLRDALEFACVLHAPQLAHHERHIFVRISIQPRTHRLQRPVIGYIPVLLIFRSCRGMRPLLLILAYTIACRKNNIIIPPIQDKWSRPPCLRQVERYSSRPARIPRIIALPTLSSRQRLHIHRRCLRLHSPHSAQCIDYSKICTRLAVMRGQHVKIPRNKAINPLNPAFCPIFSL